MTHGRMHASTYKFVGSAAMSVSTKTRTLLPCICCSCEHDYTTGTFSRSPPFAVIHALHLHRRIQHLRSEGWHRALRGDPWPPLHTPGVHALTCTTTPRHQAVGNVPGHEKVAVRHERRRACGLVLRDPPVAAAHFEGVHTANKGTGARKVAIHSPDRSVHNGHASLNSTLKCISSGQQPQ
eukprot:IDg17736t1